LSQAQGKAEDLALPAACAPALETSAATTLHGDKTSDDEDEDDDEDAKSNHRRLYSTTVPRGSVPGWQLQLIGHRSRFADLDPTVSAKLLDQSSHFLWRCSFAGKCHQTSLKRRSTFRSILGISAEMLEHP
jgi:hypothetical protein